MLIAAHHLLDRLRHPHARAAELALLRRRFAAVPAAASASERALAEELRRVRLDLAAALAGVVSCARCARRHPLPHGRYPGGHCCGTCTANVFTDDEVAALRRGGTTPLTLRLPPGEQAGCVFRGASGCSLDPADRPNLCVRYLCLELEGELRERGDLRSIKAMAAALARGFEQFQRMRLEQTQAKGER